MSKTSPAILLLCLVLAGCIRNPPETTPLPLSFWDSQRLEKSLSDRDVLLTFSEGTLLSGHFLTLSQAEASLIDNLGNVHSIPLSPGMTLEFNSAGRGLRLGFGRGFWGGFALACLMAGDTATGWILSVGLTGGSIGSLIGAAAGGTVRYEFSAPADTVMNRSCGTSLERRPCRYHQP